MTQELRKQLSDANIETVFKSALVWHKSRPVRHKFSVRKPGGVKKSIAPGCYDISLQDWLYRNSAQEAEFWL